MGEEGALTKSEQFGGKLNSKFHEATPVLLKMAKPFILQEIIS